jgi:hypothetical protein
MFRGSMGDFAPQIGFGRNGNSALAPVAGGARGTLLYSIPGLRAGDPVIVNGPSSGNLSGCAVTGWTVEDDQLSLGFINMTADPIEWEQDFTVMLVGAVRGRATPHDTVIAASASQAPGPVTRWHTRAPGYPAAPVTITATEGPLESPVNTARIGPLKDANDWTRIFAWSLRGLPAAVDVGIMMLPTVSFEGFFCRVLHVAGDPDVVVPANSVESWVQAFDVELPPL